MNHRFWFTVTWIEFFVIFLLLCKFIWTIETGIIELNKSINDGYRQVEVELYNLNYKLGKMECKQ